MSHYDTHNNTLQLVLQQLIAYLKLHPVACVRRSPFQMHLDGRIYGPDVQVIKNSNPHLEKRYMNGPADMCIEVVDARSTRSDHGSKLEDYERHGIQEYWIIDALRREVRAFRLLAAGHYISQPLDRNECLVSTQLPGFKLFVPRLWHASVGLIMPFDQPVAGRSDLAPRKSQSGAYRHG